MDDCGANNMHFKLPSRPVFGEWQKDEANEELGCRTMDAHGEMDADLWAAAY
jgi:hypothetical protein